jgi:thymidylate kinase
VKLAFRESPLATVLRLFDALSDAGIQYCHWKSSAGLLEALAGRTDLDLLVDRSQKSAFGTCIAALGFKRFISHPSRQLPGVEDWLGFDAAERRLVHLHVYYELVLGEELVKNHRLPIEAVLLANTTLQHGVRVPRPELELAILAVRGLLKYREDAFLRDMLPIGHRGGLPSGILDEIGELLERTTISAVRDAIRQHLPMLPPSVIADFIEEVSCAAPDPRRVRTLRRHLERALLPFRRRGELALVPIRTRTALTRSRFARAVRHLAERFRQRPSGHRKRSAAGGLTVGIIGVDGAGKSTVIDALQTTFAWRVNVATLYLGSARPGTMAAAAQGASRVTRRARAWIERHIGRQGPLARFAGRAADAALDLRGLAEARDRARRVQLGRDLAADGWLVLFDRYPMPELKVGHRRMDAARIATGAGRSWPSQRLSLRERAIYRRIARPDLLVVLRVDPRIARARKPLAPDSLESKAGALAALGGGDAATLVVDASAPLEDVLRQVTAAVWDRL